MTQLETARREIITPEMEVVVGNEEIDREELRALIAAGRVVVPANKNHYWLKPIGIGEGLSVKINANIGTSADHCDLQTEIEKLKAAIEAGADTVMDLSTGGNLPEIRNELLKNCPLPFGTVPVYQLAWESRKKGVRFVDQSFERMLEIIAEQAREGVDFMTIHAGLRYQAIEKLNSRPRLTGVVSRGGSLLVAWMLKNKAENPFWENFDRILEILKEYDVTISVGDGLRPGCLADGSDLAQISELLNISELIMRAKRAGVQAMVEGPGHLPLNQIEMNIKLEKEICQHAPFYVLGPVVTDIAPGYDHLTSAIGGAIAAYYGADFLCYVTPGEHLALPTVSDVREGVIYARIAAHVADLARGSKKAWKRDNAMAKARADLDWDLQKKLSIDPQKFTQIRSKQPTSTEACSMCSDLCVFKIMGEFNNECRLG